MAWPGGATRATGERGHQAPHEQRARRPATARCPQKPHRLTDFQAVHWRRLMSLACFRIRSTPDLCCVCPTENGLALHTCNYWGLICMQACFMHPPLINRPSPPCHPSPSVTDIPRSLVLSHLRPDAHRTNDSFSNQSTHPTQTLVVCSRNLLTGLINPISPSKGAGRSGLRLSFACPRKL